MGEFNDGVAEWIEYLRTHGIKRQASITGLGYFAVSTSDFGPRNVTYHGAGPAPSHQHEATDFTVLTRQHLDKYPELRADVEKILEDFPGLRDGYVRQLAQFETPADIQHVPVLAVADGVIGYAGELNDASGRSMTLLGDNAFAYGYAHLAGYAVEPGTRVRQGDVIGYIGQPDGHTGTQTGPCLHIKVRGFPFAGRPGEEIDPPRWQYINSLDGDGNDTGMVPPTIVDARFRELEAQLRGPITLGGLYKLPGTFMYDTDPSPGTPLRPYRNDYLTQAQVEARQAVSGNANTGQAPQDDWHWYNPASWPVWSVFENSSAQAHTLEGFKPLIRIELTPEPDGHGLPPQRPTGRGRGQ